MSETLIRPQYFCVNGASGTSLTVYDYRLPGVGPEADHKFQVLLSGKKLCSCSTKDGFLLKVLLPPGTYRVTLQFGRGGKSAMETVVRIDRPGDYGLRVLVAPTFLGFDELVFHPA